MLVVRYPVARLSGGALCMGTPVAAIVGHQSTWTVGSNMLVSQDPLVVALSQAVSLVLERGIEVQPQGDGWFIRLADDNAQSNTARAGRSW